MIKGDSIDKKNRIQSVEVAFSILNTIAANSGAMNLSELAHATELPKNQLYRYLNSFIYLGLLARDNQDRWTLGPQLVALGSAANDGFDLTHQTSPYLIKLRDTLNETVVLSIWSNQGPIFISWEKSNKMASIVLDSWSIVPLHIATGRIYRAFLPEDLTEELYLKGISEGKINPELYNLEIEQIRQIGLSVTNGGRFDGISAISSPIFYASGKLAGAITITGVMGNLDISLDSEPAQTLLKTASDVSKKLGYQGAFPSLSK